MLNKVFFINSNIFLNDKASFNNLEDILGPMAGNVGNAYITYSLIKKLGYNQENIEHIQNIYKFDFSQQDKYVDIINNECSNVFLILQDQIRINESYNLKLPYKQIMDFIKKLNKPVVIAGLGANSTKGYNKDFYNNIDTELITFLKFLSDHCIEIGVRGEYTKEILNNFKINNVDIIGCPSFFENGRDRIVHKNKKSNKILLSSNNIHNKQTKSSDVICQDYCESDILNSLIFNEWNPNQDYFSLLKLKEHRYHFFININEWKKFVSKYDFTIGSRLHGSILSINSGVPAICINHDYRTQEMCEFLKIPHFKTLKKNLNLIDLYNSLDLSEMNNDYPSLYKNYESFLTKNNVNFSTKNEDLQIKQPVINIDYEKFNKNLDIQISNKKYSFFENIFSVKNNTTHKIISLLGIRIRIQSGNRK